MKPLADIAGNNAAHQLTTDKTIRAEVIVLTSLVGVCRLGDSSVDSTHGAALPASVPVVLSALPDEYSGGYNLSSVYVYVPTGTTLTACYK